MAPDKIADIDTYIAQFPTKVQLILKRVRKVIRQTAPEAKEVISYQMPAFKSRRILVYFAAWKEHIGLYPPVTGNKQLERAARQYAGPKGNLQFPLDLPIPYQLIADIVRWRLELEEAKQMASKKTTKQLKATTPRRTKKS